VLGIDPGSVATGYGVVDVSGSAVILVASGVLAPPARASFPARLAAVHEGLRELFERHRPNEAALEDAFLAKNARTMALISQVRGVILLATEQASVPVHEYAPRRVKLAITGRGDATKEQVAKMIVHLLALPGEPRSADESDALAVAVCHANAAARRGTPAGALAALVRR
jgi:crossover junction endodeoxyribonuclease RuvC